MIKNDYGIKAKATTVRNPQANAMIERIHQVLSNLIRTFNLEQNYVDEQDPWIGILSAAAFAIRSTYHTTLKASPGQLVFGRDMIFNIKHIANWHLIQQYKQKLIDKNNQLENSKRLHYNYQKDQKVLLDKKQANKLGAHYNGPYVIQKVHKNGTLTIQKKITNGYITERINIRRVHPYKE
jgi:hypothetical protein